MNRPRKERSLHLPAGSTPPEGGRLFKTGLFSVVLHLSLILFLALNLMSSSGRSGRAVYRVTLRPFSPPGDGRPAGSSGPGRTSDIPKPRETLKTETSGPNEALKTAETGRTERKKAEKGEVPRNAKMERKYEQPRQSKPVEGLKKTDKRGTKSETDKSGRSLQEAIEDIHKRVALDEIQKKVARRSGGEKATTEGPLKGERSAGNPTTGTSLSSRGSALIGSGTGTGTGTGPGSGVGTGTGSGGSPWGSSLLESKLNDYYSLIWTKIKDGWTLPENLPKEKTDLEAIIVVVIEGGGKLQKAWFEKKSGNTLYDQMAMRAIRRAEPFPPIPKELGDEALEIGIRFYPD